MKRILKIFAITVGVMIGLVVLLLVLAFCGIIHPEYRYDLPNGYALQSLGGTAVYISDHRYDGRGSAFDLEVAKVGVRKHLVFGYLGLGKVRSTRAIERDGMEGYFLLDTSTGQKQTGMSKEAWLAALKKHGIDKEPRLHGASSRFVGLWL